jgi:hypothetical protein
MRRFLFIIGLLLSMSSFCQDWQVLNSSWGPHYGEPGSDEITTAIRYEKVYSLGDTVRYVFPVHFEKCTECETIEALCIYDANAQDTLYIKTTPFLGDSASVSSFGTLLHGTDLFIKEGASAGDEWNYSVNETELTAEAISVDEVEIFGVLDSVKTMQFSHGYSLSLSKSYGIIEITPPNNQTIELKGIPELQLGSYFPGIREFYDFEVGDVLVYGSKHWTGFLQGYSGFHRIDINGLESDQDTLFVFYSVASIIEPFDNEGQYNTSFSEDLVMVVPFGLDKTQGLIPGLFVNPMDSLPFFDSQYLNNLDIVQLPVHSYQLRESDYFGRKSLILAGSMSQTDMLEINLNNCCNTLESPNSNQPLNIPLERFGSIDDYVLNLDVYDTIALAHNMQICSPLFEAFEFSEGLGLTTIALKTSSGFAADINYMIGFEKNGIQYGTVPEIGEILSNDLKEYDSEIKVYPNPASEQLNIQCIEPIRNIEIRDLQGKLLMKLEAESNETRVDVSTLKPGLYLVTGILKNGDTFHRRVVKE